MAQQTGTYLDRIVADKRGELATAKASTPQAEIEQLAASAPPVRPFRQALAGPQVSLIAEVKKASPSRGVLREDFDPIALAQAYARGGASAISVLTDAKHFQGSLGHLRGIRDLGDSMPPLLRKDFL
ncbi:MAG TPA: indole-3-glycerol-phosphate synthase TrpC, partial [Dehalococcoidia bacterium]|nr:indole-3-glycerol-phosphate synthase TrpC [Dehalococcoidia bacterium]